MRKRWRDSAPDGANGEALRNGLPGRFACDVEAVASGARRSRGHAPIQPFAPPRLPKRELRPSAIRITGQSFQTLSSLR